MGCFNCRSCDVFYCEDCVFCAFPSNSMKVVK